MHKNKLLQIYILPRNRMAESTTLQSSPTKTPYDIITNKLRFHVVGNSEDPT